MNRSPKSIHLCCRLGVRVVALMLLGAAGLHAQAPARASGRGVNLHIETDRPAYTVGDSVRVRVTLQNVTGASIEYVSQPPVAQARLRVLDAKGNKIPAEPSHAAQDLPSTRPVTLAPGAKHTIKWQGKEWLNLQDWGYELRTPGMYTIVGLPGVVGPKLTPDYETLRSNRATFRILP
jgi:hypothetical protein